MRRASNPSWACFRPVTGTLSSFATRAGTLCFSDHAAAPAPWELTARHVYVRGHGPSGRYRGSYSGRTLRHWADAVLAWQAQRREVFVYFDNDQKAAAPKDAVRLTRMIAD
jgi:uncharacterized protein YecE (DUF72 family)